MMGIEKQLEVESISSEVSQCIPLEVSERKCQTRKLHPVMLITKHYLRLNDFAYYKTHFSLETSFFN